MIVCKFCKREFKNKLALAGHHCIGIDKERADNKLKLQEEEKNYIFVCNGCGRKFKTLRSLNSHAGHCDLYIKDNHISLYKIHEFLYKCECGKEFNNHQSLNAHLSHCDYHHECCGTIKKLRPSEINHSMNWENKTSDEIAKIRKKSGKTYSNKVKSNDIILTGGPPNYSEKACLYIDKLNEKFNWHLQHAKNGGEIKIFNYWLDGYDKELNIVFEYDEPRHYVDIKNNILNDKDIERQNFIINNINCKFFRYNEALDKFYQVK